MQLWSTMNRIEAARLKRDLEELRRLEELVSNEIKSIIPKTEKALEEVKQALERGFSPVNELRELAGSSAKMERLAVAMAAAQDSITAPGRDDGR